MNKIKDKWAPLSAGFMLTSMLGFMISLWFIMDLSPTWGFTLAFFFVVMFIASIISMTKAEPIPEHMDHLAIHEHEKAHKPFFKTRRGYEKGEEGMKWFEPILFLYFFFWIYYIFHHFNGTLDFTNGYLAIVFMSLTLIFGIYYIVEIFSRESLLIYEQIAAGLLIFITAGYGIMFFPLAGLGLLIYYLHKKLNTKTMTQRNKL